MGPQIDENGKSEWGKSFEIEITAQHKGINIIPQCSTGFGEILTDVFGIKINRLGNFMKKHKPLKKGNDRKKRFLASKTSFN